MTEPDLGASPDEVPPTNWMALGKGDLQHLVESYWRPVFRFLRGKMREPDLAEEATQEFFLRFLQKDLLSQADPARGKFRAWLFSAARNFLVDEFRKRHAMRRGAGRSGVDLEAAGQIATPELDPALEFDRQWFSSLLNRARKALKAHYVGSGRAPVYQAFRLFYFGEREPGRWSHERIAERLGLTATQVNNFLHRSRVQFGRILRELVTEYARDEAEVAEELAAIANFLERRQVHLAAPTSLHMGHMGELADVSDHDEELESEEDG